MTCHKYLVIAPFSVSESPCDSVHSPYTKCFCCQHPKVMVSKYSPLGVAHLQEGTKDSFVRDHLRQATTETHCLLKCFFNLYFSEPFSDSEPWTCSASAGPLWKPAQRYGALQTFLLLLLLHYSYVTMHHHSKHLRQLVNFLVWSLPLIIVQLCTRTDHRHRSRVVATMVMTPVITLYTSKTHHW